MYSSWRTNLFVFATIIVLVGGYFFWQTRQALREFRTDSHEHSKALAAVVELNIRNALLSKSGLEDVVSNSLENSARFLNFLDSTEPFSSEELTAFVLESGLVGVKIVQPGTSAAVSGPTGWLPNKTCTEPSGLKHLDVEKIYLFSFLPLNQQSSQTKLGCVLVGLSAEKINRILDRISVKRLLSMLSDFNDIAYVRLEPEKFQSDLSNSISERMSQEGLRETVITIGERQLIVALKTDRVDRRIQQMQNEFLILIILLLLFGAFSSWWLYRVQHHRLKQTREFERKMARQHEDAALGRAAATITHELRNPLNAIGMGLQRLQIETKGLEQEHHRLIASMSTAVTRTNTIITRLRQYIHTFEVISQKVDLTHVITQVSRLYHAQCEKQHIKVELDCEDGLSVLGEKDLLGQLFENLLKNSVEAQPNGGFITISTGRFQKNCLIKIVNGGFSLTREESKLFFEPYFTSKSKGTGLGLVISQKIVHAHGGDLDWQIDFENKTILFSLKLPMVT